MTNKRSFFYLIRNFNFNVYYFDVGQADSILIECNDEYMLIDAGNNDDGELIVSKLQSYGIEKIDYLVGTHPHEDHIGGIPFLLQAANSAVALSNDEEESAKICKERGYEGQVIAIIEKYLGSNILDPMKEEGYGYHIYRIKTINGEEILEGSNSGGVVY